MASFNDILVKKNSTIIDVIKIIDSGTKQVALVVDENMKLLGTINDGDIRRAILNKLSLDSSIENVYIKNPMVANINETKEALLNLCSVKKIKHIPLIDEKGLLVGLSTLDELVQKNSKKNRVILMVGGLGERLKPLTNETPKPMLNVGGKPILQTIVERFVSYGFTNITMCTGHKSNVVKDFFEDGAKFGAKVDYIFETKRMGTAGALSLLASKIEVDDPFFVMNGDLLTNVNFENLLDFHLNNDAAATMCVKEYDYKVPYGVISLNDINITSIQEKPVHNFFVNAGIYILNPNCIELIPKNQFFDMTSLFDKVIRKKYKAISFPIREYWLDIGRHSEFQEANTNYKNIF